MNCLFTTTSHVANVNDINFSEKQYWQSYHQIIKKCLQKNFFFFGGNFQLHNWVSGIFFIHEKILWPNSVIDLKIFLFVFSFFPNVHGIVITKENLVPYWACHCAYLFVTLMYPLPLHVDGAWIRWDLEERKGGWWRILQREYGVQTNNKTWKWRGLFTEFGWRLAVFWWSTIAIMIVLLLCNPLTQYDLWINELDLDVI